MRRLALVVAIMVLAASSVLAQSPPARPACPHPGACFITGWVVVFSDPDPLSGDTVAAVIPGSADDFIRYGPNGAEDLYFQDRESYLYYCPRSAYPACWDRSQGYPGLIEGMGRANAMQQGDGVSLWCPSVWNFDGVVTTASGLQLKLNYFDVWRKDAEGEGGCRQVQTHITVTPVLN